MHSVGDEILERGLNNPPEKIIVPQSATIIQIWNPLTHKYTQCNERSDNNSVLADPNPNINADIPSVNKDTVDTPAKHADLISTSISIAQNNPPDISTRSINKIDGEDALQNNKRKHSPTNNGDKKRRTDEDVNDKIPINHGKEEDNNEELISNVISRPPSYQYEAIEAFALLFAEIFKELQDGNTEVPMQPIIGAFRSEHNRLSLNEAENIVRGYVRSNDLETVIKDNEEFICKPFRLAISPEIPSNSPPRSPLRTPPKSPPKRNIINSSPPLFTANPLLPPPLPPINSLRGNVINSPLPNVQPSNDHPHGVQPPSAHPQNPVIYNIFSPFSPPKPAEINPPRAGESKFREFPNFCR